jgi:glycosyltransferase involved in cell wall biosynthesis
MAAPGMTPDTRIAVVVCTRDRPELLTGLIPALITARDDGADVVVVDSASRGPETRDVAERAGLRVVRCARPGASRARNAGLAAVAANVVVFTDDDCRPHAGWHRRLAGAFSDELIGFATGQVLPGAGEGRAMSPMIGTEPVRWSGDADVRAMGHGANMAFRRTALTAIGGFDEVLGAGAPLRGSEDKDVFWRLLSAGWDGVFIPDAIVEHAAWRGHAEALRTGFGYGIGIGARTAKVARLAGGRVAGPVSQQSWASLRQIGSAVRSGHRFGVANLTLRSVGILIGGARARRYELLDGRFVPQDK